MNFESEQARLDYLRQQLGEYEAALLDVEALLPERDAAVINAQSAYDQAREALRQVLAERSKLVSRWSRESDNWGIANNGAALGDQDRSALRDFDEAEAQARDAKQQASRALEDAFAARGEVTSRRDNYRWAIVSLRSNLGTSERLIEQQAATVKRTESSLLKRIRDSVAQQHASTA